MTAYVPGQSLAHEDLLLPVWFRWKTEKNMVLFLVALKGSDTGDMNLLDLALEVLAQERHGTGSLELSIEF